MDNNPSGVIVNVSYNDGTLRSFIVPEGNYHNTSVARCKRLPYLASNVKVENVSLAIDEDQYNGVGKLGGILVQDSPLGMFIA